MAYQVFDLKTKANLCFKKDKIKEYLTLLMSHEGKEACHVASHYIIAVLGRYKRDPVMYTLGISDIGSSHNIKFGP